MDSLSLKHDLFNSEEADRCLNLVKAIAGDIHRKLPRSAEFDDLYQNGVIGLIEALNKYNPERGVPFLSFARFRIRGAILDGLRRADILTRPQRREVKRVQDAAGTEEFPFRSASFGPTLVSTSSPRGGESGGDGVALEGNLPSSDQSPYQQLQMDETRRLLQRAMEDMPERHRQIVQMIFEKDLTAREVAEQLGVNESRISQIRGIALRKMSARFLQHGLSFGDFWEAAC